MTSLEASFLALESPGIPMHVGGLVLLDGRQPVAFDELRELLAPRLRRLPKFRQRIAGGALGLTRPRWTSARLDLDAHLFHHRLHAPGRLHELFALAARIHETLLPRDQPLWEMHLVDGVNGHDQALLIKTHHAITDGLAGIEIAEVLFDPDRGNGRPPLPATRFATTPPLPGWAAVQAALGVAYATAGGPLALPGPFNGPVGPHRAFGATAISLDAVRGAKRLMGSSIDDVIVATVGAGLFRYLREVGYPEIPHALRVMLPVSTRRPEKRVRLGNSVSSIFIDLPMRTTDLAELVPAVAHAKATVRAAHAAAGGTALVELAAMLPAPVHRPLLQIVSALPFAHVVLSDVPGPDSPMNLLGRRITACYPLMPLTRDIGLSIATVGMAGRIGIGVTADPCLVPNPQRVANAIGRAFGAFEAAHLAHARRQRQAA